MFEFVHILYFTLALGLTSSVNWGNFSSNESLLGSGRKQMKYNQYILNNRGDNHEILALALATVSNAFRHSSGRKTTTHYQRGAANHLFTNG